MNEAVVIYERGPERIVRKRFRSETKYIFEKKSVDALGNEKWDHAGIVQRSGGQHGGEFTSTRQDLPDLFVEILERYHLLISRADENAGLVQ